ncbi:Bax inhibitor 1 [Trichinella nativa]|uniref:Bax inhibitor 1 n=1 Tax=Trichinella nativa TaxID=6335 RepID=A0A0V1KTX6_9BILA|nr:Bax inhibitor 1 [Trichinella nativa]
MSKTMLNTLSSFYNTLDQKIEKPVQTHLRRVYFSLSASLLAAAAGAYVHLFTDFISGSVWSVLGSLVLLITINATVHTRENELYRFLALMAFSALSGLSTGPLLDFVISVNASLIVTAFMVTAVLFGCFTLAALIAPDRKYLYLIGKSPALFQVNLYTGLAVMCGFIVYDTQLIMEKKRMVIASICSSILLEYFVARLLFFVKKRNERKEETENENNITIQPRVIASN